MADSSAPEYWLIEPILWKFVFTSIFMEIMQLNHLGYLNDAKIQRRLSFYGTAAETKKYALCLLNWLFELVVPK